MKRHLVLLLLIVAAMFPPVPAAVGQVTSWQQIPIPTLHPFHPQQPKRVQLPNGMVIFLQEDHELPLIDAVARIRGGSREESAKKTGLIDIYGDVWRTGGTKSQTGDQLDDYLEIRAAKVETGGGGDSTNISLSCLKDDFDDVFKVFVDLLRAPEFREDKIDLAKKGEDDSIARRNDDIGGIAARESVKLAYGANNPYARVPEYATIAAIERQDLINWHQTYVHPNNIIFGVVGDFDEATMEARLRQAFESWTKGPSAPRFETQFQPAKPGYYEIDKNDVNQSSIRMLQLGTRRDNPDYYAIEVFNEAFGGGFSSRLFSDIRTAKGLAYSVGGGIGTSFDHPGILRLSVGTKSQSTVESIQALFEEIDNLSQKPITENEIKRAKDSILNSFIFNFDSPSKVIQERMAYEFYGYPADFLERYRAGVDKITPPDVARVASKYLHKDTLAVLVVGNTAEFDKPLSTLGPVTKLDITIPPPAEQQTPEAARPAGSNPEGKALAAKVVASMGGEARLQAVKLLRVELNLTQSGGGTPTAVVTTLAFPDRMRAEIQGPQGALTIVVAGDKGFVSVAGMGVQDLPASQQKETAQQIRRNPVYIGQHLNDPAFVFFAHGAEKVGDVEARVVDIAGGDLSMRWYVDPASGHILRETYPTVGREGPVQGETDFSDWKTTDGLTIAMLHKNKQNGQDSSVAQFTSVQVNPAVDPKLFEKPESEKTAAH